MLIRQASLEDADALFEVHRSSVLSFCAASYSPEHIAEWFLGRTSQIYESSLNARSIWIADAEGRTLGFVEAVPGEVTLLFVAPKESGRSVGSKLLEFGAQRAAGATLAPVTVIATKNAVSFYRRHGFKVVAEEFFTRGEPPRQYPVVRMVREAHAEGTA